MEFSDNGQSKGMGRRVKIRLALLLTLVSLGLVWPASARRDDFKIIVHPRNPVTVIDRDFAQDAYLKKAIRWAHGDPIQPIMLPHSLPASVRFTEEILKKSPAQLRAYWIQRIFSGRGTPPLEAESTAAVIDRVLGDTGAIGIIPAEADARPAKVVGLR